MWFKVTFRILNKHQSDSFPLLLFGGLGNGAGGRGSDWDWTLMHTKPRVLALSWVPSLDSQQHIPIPVLVTSVAAWLRLCHQLLCCLPRTHSFSSYNLRTNVKESQKAESEWFSVSQRCLPPILVDWSMISRIYMVEENRLQKAVSWPHVHHGTHGCYFLPHPRKGTHTEFTAIFLFSDAWP